MNRENIIELKLYWRWRFPAIKLREQKIGVQEKIEAYFLESIIMSFSDDTRP